MTAYQIIQSALRLIGAYAAGEPLQVQDANDGLDVFDQMVDGWNADRLAIFTTRSDDFPFVIGQQSYTLGTGGNFNIPRPPRIDAMSSILLSPSPANPVEVPIDMYTVEQWQTQVPVKTVNSSWPQICYDDGGFPLRTLNFWPIPVEQNNVRIYSWQALAAPATLSTVISFPPGYAEAFRYNLAVRLAAEYAAPVPAAVGQIAVESLAKLKTMNAPELTLRSDLIPDPSGWNYRADMFNLGF